MDVSRGAERLYFSSDFSLTVGSKDYDISVMAYCLTNKRNFVFIIQGVVSAVMSLARIEVAEGADQGLTAPQSTGRSQIVVEIPSYIQLASNSSMVMLPGMAKTNRYINNVCIRLDLPEGPFVISASVAPLSSGLVVSSSDNLDLPIHLVANERGASTVSEDPNNPSVILRRGIAAQSSSQCGSRDNADLLILLPSGSLARTVQLRRGNGELRLLVEPF